MGLLSSTFMLEAAGHSQSLGYVQVFPKAWASWSTCHMLHKHFIDSTKIAIISSVSQLTCVCRLGAMCSLGTKGHRSCGDSPPCLFCPSLIHTEAATEDRTGLQRTVMRQQRSSLRSCRLMRVQGFLGKFSALFSCFAVMRWWEVMDRVSLTPHYSTIAVSLPPM